MAIGTSARTAAREARRERARTAEARRARQDDRANQPIRYKLPAHLTDEATPDQTPSDRPREQIPEAEDYAPLVRGCLRAAGVILLTQILATILLANLTDSVLRIGFWFAIIPHLQLQVLPAEYGTIITWSTTVAVAAGCVGLLHALIRHRSEPMLIDGWGFVLPMNLFFLILQQLREWSTGWDLVDGWIFAQAAAATIATALVFFGFRPGKESPALAGRIHGPLSDANNGGVGRPSQPAKPHTGN